MTTNRIMTEQLDYGMLVSVRAYPAEVWRVVDWTIKKKTRSDIYWPDRAGVPFVECRRVYDSKSIIRYGQTMNFWINELIVPNPMLALAIEIDGQ